MSQCPSLQSLYERNQQHYQAIDFIETARRNCGYRQYGHSPIVCCQDPIITIQYPNQSSSQLQSSKPPSKPIQHSPVTRPPTYNAYLQPAGKICRDPNGLNGVCMNIKECPAVLNEFVTRFDDQRYIEFIKRSNRYCDNIRPFICCPEAGEGKSDGKQLVSITNGSNIPEKVRGRFLTPEEGCGISNVTHLRLAGSSRIKKGNSLFVDLCLHFYKIYNTLHV